MPRYSSRFATHMTRHERDSLRLIDGPLTKLPYAGPERQCQAIAWRSFGQGTVGHRCPHAAKWIRDGAYICGVDGMAYEVLVTGEA